MMDMDNSHTNCKYFYISRPTFQPPKVSGLAQDASSTTATTTTTAACHNKPVRKTSSIDSPGSRKLIRTPTQVIKQDISFGVHPVKVRKSEAKSIK